MTFEIALFLGQDGLVNAAIYALMAIAIVLVYAVTRIVLIPQGQFVSYGALTFAGFLTGKTPGTVWLLFGGSIWAASLEIRDRIKRKSSRRSTLAPLLWVAYATCVAAAAAAVANVPLSQPAAMLLTFASVVPLGPIVYRIAFERIAHRSILTLLIVAMALDLVSVGLGLVAFGAEGSQNPAIAAGSFMIGPLLVTVQSVWVLTSATIITVALALFFGRTITGKALQATAINRMGAKLVGIRTVTAGRLSFSMAAGIGSVCGILISPITIIYFNTGFLIGLKGFVAAIIGGLVSYPLAVAGALLVGLLEAFSSFWASGYKEVIVFTLIIPVLVWRSMRTHSFDES